MKPILALVVVPILTGQICRAAEEPTAVTIGDITYGARADQRGPIGGGPGYTAVEETIIGKTHALVERLNKVK